MPAERGPKPRPQTDGGAPRTREEAPSAAPGHGGERGVSFVVPTFREAANIRSLTTRLASAMAGNGIQWELVLVDDDSADGTEHVTSDLARTLPVRLEIRRELPRDLSLAVLRGFQVARYERIVVMDADLSHPPEIALELLDALDSGFDMAVGSRYAEGGSLDPNSTLGNLLNSQLATGLARPLARCADPLSGFFAIRRSALPARCRLRPVGYKIGLELLVRGRLLVKEVPIRFAARQAGQSKTNWKQRYKFLVHLGRLYRARQVGVARALGAAIVPAGALALDMTAYLALTRALPSHDVGRLLAACLATAWTWAVQRLVNPWHGAPLAGRHRGGILRPEHVRLLVSVGCYVALTASSELMDRHRLATLLLGVAAARAATFFTAAVRTYRRLRATEQVSGG